MLSYAALPGTKGTSVTQEGGLVVSLNSVPHSFVHFLRKLSLKWSIINFPHSPTRNITSHSVKNLTFRSLLRWKIVILPILKKLMYILNIVKAGLKKTWVKGLTCLPTSCLPSWLFSGHAALFATLIAKTAKDIDFLIDSLPSKECSPELQVCAMFLLCCTCNYVKMTKNQLIRCIHNT